MSKKYFSVFEIVFLSLMAAILFFFRSSIKTPIRLPGHNGIFWVVPIIIGIGVTKKIGSATYVGLIAGILLSFVGISDDGPFKFLEYLIMGITIDLLAVVFKGYVDKIAVGLVIGSIGNLAKLFINYYVTILTGVPAAFILVGVGFASVSHVIFGGLGGIISAIILKRLKNIELPHKSKVYNEAATTI